MSIVFYPVLVIQRLPFSPKHRAILHQKKWLHK